MREAHRERRALLETVAPHLVRRLPFLFPLYRDGPYRPTTLRLGLALYSALAGDRLGGLLPPARALQSVPDLRLDGLRGCGVYIDSFTHDGRLCLANVRAAAAAGGVVANYAEVVALRQVAGRVRGAELRDRLSGETLSVEARAVVNATGPWIDGIRALEDPAAPPLGRLSKGVHLLLDLDRPWSAALTIPHDPVRVTFAYPWQGMLLLGTTDTLYEGDPSEVAVEPADVARVLDEASVGVEREVLDPGRVRASFAGLRVLPGLSGETLTARRETQYVLGRGGMLTVAGGKLTTYRRIALAALERLRPELGGPRFDPAAGAAAGRARARGRGPRGSRAASPSSIRQPARTSCTCTAAWRRRCSRLRCSSRRCSSRSTRTHPTCSRRSGTQASRSGRSASRTSSGGGRRSAIAAWRTPPPRGWRSGSRTRRRRERRGLGPVLGRAVISPGRSRVSSRSWRTRAHRCPSSLVQSHSGAT